MMGLKEVLLAGLITLTGCELYVMQPTAGPELIVFPFKSVDYFFSPCEDCSYNPQQISLLKEYLGDKINLWCTASEKNFEEDSNNCEKLYGQSGIGGANKLAELGYQRVPLLLVDQHPVTYDELCRLLRKDKGCLA